MTTQTLFPTRFGMFASCDYATYKKLKQINRLLQFARSQARRWQRAQRRLPANRYFVRRSTSAVAGKLHTTVTRRFVTDEIIFKPFWKYAPAEAKALAAKLEPTSLLNQFLTDYHRARHPAAIPSETQPLTLTPDEIAHLLAELENWYRNHWQKW